jgi:hypothetical protein
MSVKTIVGTETYEKVRKALQATFPDKSVKIKNDVVDVFINEAWKNWKPEFQQLGLKERKPVTLSKPQGSTSNGVKYYTAHSTHHRFTPIESKFMGHVPVVRIEMPKTPFNSPIETAYGLFYPGDHLINNVKSLNTYLEKKKKVVRRAEFITPVRDSGARFAAVAVGVAYVDDDTTPDFYWLEAGMATGEPMVLYWSEEMDEEIIRRSMYKPTPFSNPKNWYTGKFTWENNEPKSLHIKSSQEKNGDPYICVDVCYELSTTAKTVFPGKLLMEAAVRVCMIARAKGEEVPDLGPLTNVVAMLGDTLSWEIKP